jgi:SAM-dependent methyltransferase
VALRPVGAFPQADPMPEPPKPGARYYPQIFNASDMKAAKEIILTNEGPGADTESRWTEETPYVTELVRAAIGLQPGMTVLDYGCGIGRMAKAMIEVSGCSVVGVDISANMRRLAPAYVGSNRFVVLSPVEFDIMVRAGLRVHAAIAVWVLQHCLKPAEDIARIRRSLAVDGTLFVLNLRKRVVPVVVDSGTRFGWAEDGIDVMALIQAEFRIVAGGTPDKLGIPNMSNVGMYWMALRPRAG